jgi:hypothetical protein
MRETAATTVILALPSPGTAARAGVVTAARAFEDSTGFGVGGGGGRDAGCQCSQEDKDIGLHFEFWLWLR